MPDYHIPLFPGETYHLFSRAVGNERLFLTDENYYYFLSKFKLHVTPVADLHTYTLLPNHFHLLVRIKEADEIIPYYQLAKKHAYHPMETSLPDFKTEHFSNWLNDYTKAYNKMHNRKGSLFMDDLKRSHAVEDEDVTNFLWYIHKNAVHHGSKVGDWQFDAYQSILSNAPTQLLRNEVLEWFGGRDGFIKFHQQPVELKVSQWLDM